jgi:hypothetical protein
MLAGTHTLLRERQAGFARGQRLPVRDRGRSAALGG